MCILVALQFLGQCGFPLNRRDVITLLNSKRKRKRAQSKTGEFLTKENVFAGGSWEIPQNWDGTEQNLTVICVVLKAKANDRRQNLALNHDEFRGP
ncbi:hypothetical protein TNCV_982021 [Trichonephila clavipes]|nr:hypothetical protein TNCV_982021 [Trichonephila clavipes]